MRDLTAAGPECAVEQDRPRSPVRPNPSPVEALIASGVRIPLDRRIVTPPIEAALRSGTYEADETRSLPDVVQNGDRVLELGAGMGFVSTILAKRTRAAKILAMEANPLLVAFMRQVHALNGVKKVETLNAVAGAGGPERQGETARFYARPDFWMSSLSPEPYAYDRVYNVPMVSLNMLLRNENINMIVCDIEGGEAALLPEADLAGVDRVYVEVHDHLTGLSGVKKLFDGLSAKGFAYDQRHSRGSVVLFTKLGTVPDKRPYAG